MSNSHYLPDNQDNAKKWLSLPQRIDTPLGKGTVRKRRLNPVFSTSYMSKYEGIIQDVTHVHTVIVDYDKDAGHIEGRDESGQLITRQSTCIVGRTKQVNNKKATGEARRKQSQKVVDSINVKSRAYYKARYSK